MPNVSEMLESKYLKKEEVEPAKLVTVASFEKVNLGMDGQPAQWKWAMRFEELDKPMILNATNIRICEMVFASGDTDDWIGNKLVLFNDPTIQFQGKFTGGIRVRGPKKAAAKPTVADIEDDIPF